MKRFGSSVSGLDEMRSVLNAIRETKLPPPQSFKHLGDSFRKFQQQSRDLAILQSQPVLDLVSPDILGEYCALLAGSKRLQATPFLLNYLEQRILRFAFGDLQADSATKLLWFYNKYQILPSKQLVVRLEEEVWNSTLLSYYDLFRLLGFYSNMRVFDYPEFSHFAKYEGKLFGLLEDKLHKEKATNKFYYASIARFLCSAGYFTESLWKQLLHRLIQDSIQFKLEKVTQNSQALLFTLDIVKTLNPDLYQTFHKDFQILENKHAYCQESIQRGEVSSGLSVAFEEKLQKQKLIYDKAKILEKFCLVDFFMEPNLVIELDGPLHFIRFYEDQTARLLNGRSMLKTKVLEAKGYKVVRIPHTALSDAEQILTTLDPRK